MAFGRNQIGNMLIWECEPLLVVMRFEDDTALTLSTIAITIMQLQKASSTQSREYA